MPVMEVPGDTPTEPLDITVSSTPNATEVPASTANFLQLPPIVTLLLPYDAVRLTSEPPANVTEVLVKPRPFRTD